MSELYNSNNGKISNGVNEDKYLNINEAAEYLQISTEEIKKLVDQGKIPAYSIGGIFLRFKKNQIEAVKGGSFDVGQTFSPSEEESSFYEKFKDFIYFNDFYIISIVIVLIILIIIFI